MPYRKPSPRLRLADILETMLADHGHAWELEADGRWLGRWAADSGNPGSDTQDLLMARTVRLAKRSRQGR